MCFSVTSCHTLTKQATSSQRALLYSSYLGHSGVAFPSPKSDCRTHAIHPLEPKPALEILLETPRPPIFDVQGPHPSRSPPSQKLGHFTSDATMSSSSPVDLGSNREYFSAQVEKL